MGNLTMQQESGVASLMHLILFIWLSPLVFKVCIFQALKGLRVSGTSELQIEL